jgi:hypothetical protein
LDCRMSLAVATFRRLCRLNLQTRPLWKRLAHTWFTAKLAGKLTSDFARACNMQTLIGDRWRIMQKCSTCGNEFTGLHCPSCGGEPLPTSRQINKALNYYPVPSLAGLFGVLAAVHFYPLLDRNSLFVTVLCIFFVPIVFHISSSVRKRLALDVDRLKRTYLYCGAAVIFLALLISANGALDSSPVRLVHSSIVRRNITSGRHSTTHHLHVASWRPGKSTEDLAVPIPLYARASVGQAIIVEVHNGLFNLPWYGKIVLE